MGLLRVVVMAVHRAVNRDEREWRKQKKYLIGTKYQQNRVTTGRLGRSYARTKAMADMLNAKPKKSPAKKRKK